MADKFTEQQIAEFKEAFSMFANTDETIPIKQIPSVIHSLGQNPTKAELRHLIFDLYANGFRTVGFQQFLIIMARKKNDTNDCKQLIAAFRVLETHCNGFVSANDLRNIMTNLGDKLTDEEANEMIREVDANGDGMITCEELVTLLTSK